MLSVVNFGLGLELVYMFGVAGNVQIMFIASLITLVKKFYNCHFKQMLQRCNWLSIDMGQRYSVVYF